MSTPETTPGTWLNALRELELSSLTQADRARIEILRRALAVLTHELGAEKADHLATSKRWWAISDRQLAAIAKARRLIRRDGADLYPDAYAALDWRNR